MNHLVDRPLPVFTVVVLLLSTIAPAVPPFTMPDAAPRMPGPAPAGGPYDSSGVTLLSQMVADDLDPDSAGPEANDCWGYVSPEGREYAIVALTTATAFVEITDPTNPQLIEVIPDNFSIWSDVKVYGHYAYNMNENSAGGGNGIQVIDLDQIDDGIVTLLQEYHGPENITKAHNIAIDTDSGFLYAVGSNLANGGLVAYDLADPANPVFVGSWDEAYVHDAQVVTHPVNGRQLAFCAAGSDRAVYIVNVTNKSAMRTMSVAGYPQARYCHQCWASEDLRYLYVGDELDEQSHGFTTRTLVFDISDLAFPELVNTVTTGLPSIDHNLYVHNGLIYEANYTSGLRIFDTFNPIAPQEVAYFDTHPEDNAVNFRGAWSTYPFFPSGVVIVSDRDRGLFVLELDLGEIPTTSEWALAVLAILVLAAGTIVFRRRRGSPVAMR